MQAEFMAQDGPQENVPYNVGVPRKLTKPRPRQGAYLAELRKAAGLSQADLARLVGDRQSNIAYWEMSEKPPRSDVLPKIAKALGVRVEALLGVDGAPHRPSGPAGKARKAFEEVAKLPRRQQEKIVEFVSALVNQYRHTASSGN